jgi:hypothetical protein
MKSFEEKEQPMDKTSLCPLKFAGSLNLCVNALYCEKEKCAWWCSWSNSCALVAIPGEISNKISDLEQTIRPEPPKEVVCTKN